MSLDSENNEGPNGINFMVNSQNSIFTKTKINQTQNLLHFDQAKNYQNYFPEGNLNNIIENLKRKKVNNDLDLLRISSSLVLKMKKQARNINFTKHMTKGFFKVNEIEIDNVSSPENESSKKKSLFYNKKNNDSKNKE